VLRYLPTLLIFAFLVYCLIDCIQTPAEEIRNLPKLAWALLILIFPVIAGVAWLVAGRPRRSASVGGGPGRPGIPRRDRQRRPVAPDDDPEFLSSLKKSNDEHDRLLAQWERDLQRREKDVSGDAGAAGPAPKQPPGPKQPPPPTETTEAREPSEPPKSKPTAGPEKPPAPGRSSAPDDDAPPQT